MRRISRFLVILAAGSLGACSTVGKSVAFDHSEGTKPTIVLQSGLGDDRTTWNGIYDALLEKHSVFAYDRPGYGGSAPALSPRDPCTIATELHALLGSSGVEPPYILVGHSLGGLYQYVFGRLFPEDTAALVLLDPTHPKHWETLQRDAPGNAAMIKSLRATLFGAAARREFDEQAQCLDRFDKSGPLSIPTRILVSTRPSPLESEGFQKMTLRLRDDWLRLTGAEATEPVAGAGHYLHRDAPRRVLEAIEAVKRR
ncbi:MAG: alpha/beta fold hydrolase [Steroidobacteraceae bacterium]|nr:alpha/beta fold hydrolase [Steroidobacteraceae bacterium]